MTQDAPIADTGLEQFGLKQELDRVLSLRSLIFFGLAYINVIGALTLYGLVTKSTHGMFALAFAIATVAMLFTAVSYAKMVRAYPISGSAYSYAQRTLGAHVGFMVGWVILLDYIILPITNFLLIGLYLNVLLPDCPVWVFSLISIVIITALNIRGVTLSANVGGISTLLGIAFLAAFLIFMIRYLVMGNGAGTVFSLSGFVNKAALADPAIGWGAVFAACSILCLCFLGFDAITTFAEETIEPERNIGKALMISCLIAGAIFIVIAYFSQLSWPDAVSSIENPDTAATELIRRVGGPVMSFLFSVLFIAGCFGSGVASMSSGARVLYVMGRDRALPSKLAMVHSKWKTPVVAIAAIAAVSCVSLFIDLLSIASIVNFGGLIAFTIVNVCVIAHYFIRNGHRSGIDVLRYLVAPAIGAVICFVIWLNLDSSAFIVGGSWTAIGVVYLAVQTRGFRRSPVRLDV